MPARAFAWISIRAPTFVAALLVTVIFAVASLALVRNVVHAQAVTCSSSQAEAEAAGYNYIAGTGGNDNLEGTDGADFIVGLGGDDTIGGEGGNDFLCGGDGNDTIAGADDDDTISGGDGNDDLRGEDGVDTLSGGNGNDTLKGGDGNDTLNGGAGDDNLNGTDAADTLNGDGGNDTLTGEDGNDTLNGGDGDDTLSGGDQDDTLNGGNGNDTINGGDDNDTLAGGAGTDTLTGDGGTDTVTYAAAAGPITVSLAAGTATGEGSDTLATIENLIGSPAGDTLTGDGGANVLTGGAGDDTLTGNAGNDTLNGGAGFIGSCLVRRLLGPELRALVSEVVVLDKFTYAGDRANLAPVMDDRRLTVVVGDIGDAPLVDQLMANVDRVLNLAAETHVDRSIEDALSFIDANVRGAYVVLDAARRHDVEYFLQMSTDEVYGVPEPGYRSRETDVLSPRNPYAASKASAELLCHAFKETFGLPIVVTRSSNNVGPHQHIEKLVPRFTTNALRGLSLPLHGDGKQQRDWLYVEDHCEALTTILTEGEIGSTYNVGANQEHAVEQVAEVILDELGGPVPLVHVQDRPGNDRRYAIDTRRVDALGWSPRHDFEQAIRKTVRWYRDNEDWWRPLIEAESAPGGFSGPPEGSAV